MRASEDALNNEVKIAFGQGILRSVSLALSAFLLRTESSAVKSGLPRPHLLALRLQWFESTPAQASSRAKIT